ncbi:MAG: sigma-70 family RNA polymerase sigma factor, partial [Planctomycetes bacterium]|nr:sigma-70 family RNA polymerase sigma factor [Planctomycetota bacterium]
MGGGMSQPIVVGNGVQQPTASSQQPPHPEEFLQDRSAFLRRFFHKRGLRSEDLEDAVSDTVLQCLEAVRRGTRIRKPAPFVTCLAHRVWFGILKKRRTAAIVVFGLPEAEPAASVPDDPSDIVPEGIEICDLGPAILLLPPRQREVIRAHYFEEKSAKQTGAAMGVKANAVRQRCSE